MFKKELIENVALYTIDKKKNEFNPPIDNTILDEIILNFTSNIASSNFGLPNRRELEFNEHSAISNFIKDFLNDNNTFKEKSRSIANKLFDCSASNATKGDLLISTYKDVDKYMIFMFKIDENHFIKRTNTGNWEDNAGLNTETKLQKGVYITISRTDDNYDSNIFNWNLESIDNLSNETQYWNEKFLDSKYKEGSSRTNSLHFKEFFNTFIDTIEDPKKVYDLNYKYISYITDNNSFDYVTFIQTIFGTSDNYKIEKKAFKKSFEEYIKVDNQNINYVFSFHKDTLKRDLKKGGFVLGNTIKITLKNNNLSSDEEEKKLDQLIKFNQIDQETGETYAKIYYHGNAKFEK